ncbi:MAG: hypothetical protein Q4F92_08525, partial [Acidaminococcus sp.]|uniref:hypothetical protein n=1 Tax=Acidaminococcus sp. TaxID=1872103 RepID=UPI0026E00472
MAHFYENIFLHHYMDVTVNSCYTQYNPTEEKKGERKQPKLTENSANNTIFHRKERRIKARRWPV